MMEHEYDLKTRCRPILEEHGGTIADKTCKILLEDDSLKSLHTPLEWVSKHYRDALTPAMISLSCEAVGGKLEDTFDPSIAMSLMRLTLYLWDDIVDKDRFKSFKPSLVGKLGEGTALIIGGLATTKAFSILNAAKMEEATRKALHEFAWDFWSKMAVAEKVNLDLRKRRNSSSARKLWILKTEGMADLGNCMKIGAVLGKGSSRDMERLADFGMCFSVTIDVWKSFLCSVNLTFDLGEKIKNRAFPYSLLWAREHSGKLRVKLDSLVKADFIEPREIKEIARLTLDAGAMENAVEIVKSLSIKAEKDMREMKKNRGSQALEALISVVSEQPELFAEKFSSF